MKMRPSVTKIGTEALYASPGREAQQTICNAMQPPVANTVCTVTKTRTCQYVHEPRNKGQTTACSVPTGHFRPLGALYEDCAVTSREPVNIVPLQRK